MKRPLWILSVCQVLALAALVAAPHAAGPKFLPDDPLALEIDDQDASTARPVDGNPGRSGWRALHGSGGSSSGRALNVNTMDEVPDSNWFTNRIGARQVSVADIARGPDTLAAPPSGPWTVMSGKSDGVTPGLRLKDAAGRLFFVKFDPPRHPEMASGAEVVATKLLFALGYRVPENYIATLGRDQLALGPAATFKEADGTKRPMTAADVDRVLARAARNADGTYRMLASLAVEGKALGPFRYEGTRPDDPNDVVPHEHRRELRALRVFAAWLNHVDTKSENSLDTLVDDGPRKVVRHYLIDFGSALGSAGTGPKSPRDGHEYAFQSRTSLLALLTLGLHTPPWLHIHYPRLRSIGRIESHHFTPGEWKPTLPNPAFQQARADDTFWAAERVMAFGDEAIRAAVQTARFSDPAATRYLGDVLIGRRQAIGRSWLNAVNPISRPVVDTQGRLAFHNAAWGAGATADQATYRVRWSLFDNTTHVSTPLGPWLACDEPRCELPPAVPPAAAFLMAEIAAIHPQHPSWEQPVRAWLRRDEGRAWVVVGFERLPS